MTVMFALGVFGAEQKLGKPLALSSATPIDQLLAQPGRYVDKTVQVKGEVTEVCQMMGCWTNVKDPTSGKMIRIKVNDGEIVFPKDAVGKSVVAEGKFTKIELTKEQAAAQAKHEAEEQGRKFDASKVKGGMTIYQIQGTGAVLAQ